MKKHYEKIVFALLCVTVVLICRWRLPDALPIQVNSYGMKDSIPARMRMKKVWGQSHKKLWDFGATKICVCTLDLDATWEQKFYFLADPFNKKWKLLDVATEQNPEKVAYQQHVEKMLAILHQERNNDDEVEAATVRILAAILDEQDKYLANFSVR